MPDDSKFCLFTSLGALVWNMVLAGLGWWLSTFVTLEDLYNQVERYNHYLSIAGLIIGVLCVLFIIWRVIQHRRAQQQL